MAVQSYALTTLTKVKRALGVPSGNTGDDTYLEELIDAASDAIETYTARKLVRRNFNSAGSTHGTTGVTDEEKITFSGDGRMKNKVMSDYPIDSGATFTLEKLTNRSNAGGETWEALDLNDDYIVDYQKGIIRLLGGLRFELGDRNYRVTMTAGYQKQSSAPWIPFDLERVCTSMVRDAYRETERRTSEKAGDISKSYDMSKYVVMHEAVLDSYMASSNFIGA